MNFNGLKASLGALIGGVGSLIASLFGGWNAALTTLVVFMAVDYITGFLVAAIFHRSRKTKSGTLDSNVGWLGLCKKGVMMAVILVAYRLDLAIGSQILKDAVVIAFIANEAISITENAGLMGVPIPNVIMRAIDVLRKKEDDDNEF